MKLSTCNAWLLTKLIFLSVLTISNVTCIDFEFANAKQKDESLFEYDYPSSMFSPKDKSVDLVWNYEEMYNDGNDIVDEILYYLRLGDEEIELGDHDEAVLVVGLTGAGKSTLVQFVGNDTNRLYSERECPLCEEFFLKDDGGTIGNQSLISQTFLPHLIVSEKTNTAYYDCPGFNDNRNASIEIANAFFIKKIADHVKHLKIVVIATHATLGANDRNSFNQLINQLVVLIKNTSKFSNSIAIIGTASIPGAASDIALVAKYENFLAVRAIELIEEKFSGAQKEAAFNIVNAFLQKGDGAVAQQTGFFRSPTDEGYLDEIELYIKNKELLSDMINVKLEFVETSADDFGYSLSADAKLVIRNVVGRITADIVNNTNDFSVETIENQCNLAHALVAGVSIDLEKYKLTLAGMLSASYNTSSTPNLKPSAYMNEINSSISKFGESVYEKYRYSLEKSGSNLDFLRDATEELDELIRPLDWVAPLLTIYPQVSENISMDLAPKMQLEIELITSSISESTTTSLKGLLQLLVDGKEVTDPNFVTHIRNLMIANYNKSMYTPGLLPSEYLTEIGDNVISISDSSGQKLSLLESLGKTLDLFVVHGNFPIGFDPPSWATPLVNVSFNVKNFVENSAGQVVYPPVFKALEDVAGKIQAKLMSKLGAIQDIFETGNLLGNLKNSLLALDSETQEYLGSENASCSGLIERTLDGFEKLNISLDAGDRENCLKFKSVMNVLELISPKGWINGIQWASPVTKMSILIKDEKKWSDFLLNLYDDLLSFEVQSDDDFNLHGWWQNMNKISNEADFNELWKKFDDANLPSIRYGNQDETTDAIKESVNRLEGLNVLLDASIKKDFRCPDKNSLNETIFQGNFVSLKFALNCAQIKSASTLAIIAYHTLYVDADIAGSNFDSQNNLNFFFIAPNVYLRDTRVFLFNGKEGEEGKVGGNAGNFFGIGEKLLKGVLSYHVTGGKGGDGKPGKDGAPGSDGRFQDFSAGSDCAAWSGGDIRIDLYKNSCNANGNQRCHAGDSGVKVFIDGFVGTQGGSGTDGTNAGAGGLGGYAKLVKLNEAIPGELKGNPGADGIPGKGGVGGSGGKNGDTNVVTVDDVKSGTQKICSLLNQYREPGGTQPDGKSGKDGVVVRALNLKNARVISDEQVSKYVTSFMSGSTNLLQNEFFHAMLIQFRDKVSSHNEIPK